MRTLLVAFLAVISLSVAIHATDWEVSVRSGGQYFDSEDTDLTAVFGATVGMEILSPSSFFGINHGTFGYAIDGEDKQSYEVNVGIRYDF